MKGKIHLGLGIFIGISSTVALNTSMIDGCLFVASTMIGSLLPDIDLPNSKISQKIPIIPTLINKCFGHRGFIHSPSFLLLTTILIHQLLSHFNYHMPFIFAGFMIGYLAHLLQDMFTKGGIPLFSPFSRRRYSLSFNRSGSSIDYILTTFIGIAWLGILNSRHDLLSILIVAFK